MGNILFNDVLDRKVEDTEEKYRATLEQSLSSFLERAVPVTASGPQVFDFKELKAGMPGEVVCVTLNATEGGPGRMIFVLGKETAARLGDMLVMGDGTATFSHEEHLEPIRDLCREVTASYASNLGLELKHRVAFDDIKIALVDITPSDFVGTAWVMNQIEIGLDQQHMVFKLVSQDFYETCYPDTGGAIASEPTEAPGREETVDPELGKEMGLVLDIELPVSIELGRTTMLIRDIVRLAPGSIVELDKLSGEPVDLFVNSRLFARGEVVVVDENFAVRVTELVAPKDNLRGRRN